MGSVVKGVFGGGSAAKKAAGAQTQASRLAVEEQRRQFDVTQEQLAPFREAGVRALTQQEALLGLSGPEQQQEAISGFVESPGQQFLRQRQEKALLRNAAAIGGLGGGNVRTALQEQAAGFAQQDFQNQLARLAGLSGTGQQTAAQLGQLGAQTAGQIGQQLQAAGQARASGILGAQQARAGLAGQALGAGVGAGLGAAGILGGGVGAGGGALLGLLSDIRLKENVQKVGELPSGLGWYTWAWNEKGRELAGNQPEFGTLAHEAKELFPDAVKEVGGYMRVNYEVIH